MQSISTVTKSHRTLDAIQKCVQEMVTGNKLDRLTHMSPFAAFNGMALLLRPPGCAAFPALSPDCNVAAYADAWLLGRSHLYPWPSCRHADPPCDYLDPEVCSWMMRTISALLLLCTSLVCALLKCKSVCSSQACVSVCLSAFLSQTHNLTRNFQCNAEFHQCWQWDNSLGKH